MISKSLDNVSAVLITKEAVYPGEVLRHIEAAGFGEIIIKKECDGIFHRFTGPTVFNDIYVQDDDCLPQIEKIFSEYTGAGITCGMTESHLKIYNKSRICLIGHGAFFPSVLRDSLDIYRHKFGEDEDFRIETDRIFTFLNFPQTRIETIPVQLESSFTPDRLSMRKDHYLNLDLLERKLFRFYCFNLSGKSMIRGQLEYLKFLAAKRLK